MITKAGYSKDPGLIPEGVVITFGREMIAEKGGLRAFIRWFELCMNDQDGTFMHKCKNRPKYEDIRYVYIIIYNRVYWRCFYGGHDASPTTAFLFPDDIIRAPIRWPRIYLAGPLVKAPDKIIRRGFQGFRYCEALF